MLPRRLPGDLSVTGELERYHADDLWKKINGAADLYLGYGFREMLFGTYSRPRAELPELETSLYEMGSDLNALGVYLAERSEDADRIEIGWEGYQTEDGLFFHKGPYYVKILDLSEDASLGPSARAIGQHIDGMVRVERQAVAEMEVFPTEGLNRDSVLYVHQDALGHGFLKRVFQAEYDIGGARTTVFYCRQNDAAQLLAKYRDYGKEFGRIEREWEADGMRLLSIQAFGHPELVFVKGHVFGGVLGCPDPTAALRLIRELLGNIDRKLAPL